MITKIVKFLKYNEISQQSTIVDLIIFKINIDINLKIK